MRVARTGRELETHPERARYEQSGTSRSTGKVLGLAVPGICTSKILSETTTSLSFIASEWLIRLGMIDRICSGTRPQSKQLRFPQSQKNPPWGKRYSLSLYTRSHKGDLLSKPRHDQAGLGYLPTCSRWSLRTAFLTAVQGRWVEGSRCNVVSISILYPLFNVKDIPEYISRFKGELRRRSIRRRWRKRSIYSNSGSGSSRASTELPKSETFSPYTVT